MTNPLNPEAGDVRTPSDPEEIAVAIAASAVLIEAWPYYSFRFGDRGRRFGQSDVAWLFTLVDSPQTRVDEQILWLAKVLACRGMPSVMLEKQLRFIVRVANRELRRGARYQPILGAANALEARRRALLDDAAMSAIADEFASRCGFPQRRFAVGAGTMIASAAVDAQSGWEEALPSLVGWIADGTMFSRAWCDAVAWCVGAVAR